MSRGAGSVGRTLGELLSGLAVLSLVVGMAAGLFTSSGRGAKARAGARLLAAALARERSRAIAHGEARGLAFDRDHRGWYWRRIRDGNGNGLRRADLAAGVDTIAGRRFRLESLVPGVRLGVAVDGEDGPPGTRRIDAESGPVRLGPGRLAAFGPLGGSTSGSLFVGDGRGGRAAVVLSGVTGRLRVWSYDPASRRWRL